jgi:hypothetical protein
LQIPCIIHEQEGLLFTRTTLNREQITCLTNWLIQNYTLLSLQRVSVHLVLDMDALQLPSNPDVRGALEQRAAIVAEATVQRAAKEAAVEDSSKSPTLKRIVRNIAPTVKTTKAPPKCIRRNELAEQQRTIDETLANFNRKIALFEKEDPASAEMLIPAKLDLQNKLRLVNALIESWKDDDSGTKKTAANGSQYCQGPDKQGSPVPVGEQPCGPEVCGIESSTEDEDDLRMALPIEGSEYDIPFLGEVSGRAGYVSGQTEGDEDDGTYRNDGVQKSNDLGFGAPYVIDLSSFKESSRHGPNVDVNDIAETNPASNRYRENDFLQSSARTLTNSSSDLEDVARHRSRRGGK